MAAQWTYKRYKKSRYYYCPEPRFRAHFGQPEPKRTLFFTPSSLHHMLKLCDEVYIDWDTKEQNSAIRMSFNEKVEYVELGIGNQMLDEYRNDQNKRDSQYSSAFDQYISDPPCKKVEIQFRLSWARMEEWQPEPTKIEKDDPSTWPTAEEENRPEIWYDDLKSDHIFLSRHFLELEKGLKAKEILNLIDRIDTLAGFESWDLRFNAARFHQLTEELREETPADVVQEVGSGWPRAPGLVLDTIEEVIKPDGKMGPHWRNFLSHGSDNETHAWLDAILKLPDVVVASA